MESSEVEFGIATKKMKAATHSATRSLKNPRTKSNNYQTNMKQTGSKYKSFIILNSQIIAKFFL